VINSYDEEVINLNDYGINVIEPLQPSYNKSTPVEDQVFVIDEDYYSTDTYESTELISAEILGVMRGVRMGRIEIRPYHYNPVENTLIVYNNLDFQVNFVGADFVLTEEMKAKSYSPEFRASYSRFLNYQEPAAAKDGFSDFDAPLKYVIVANTAFETTLEEFVNWKTKMGYEVIEYYVSSGTSNTTIKNYLQGLYDAGTPTDPAPVYVLFIGDHSGTYSIPAFNSQNSGSGGTNHITDLYFATLDGSDYIPDLYYGRISAESTTELQNALDKILPYEQYTIPDGSYLNNAMMIAGVDASYAHGFGDAQIFYGIDNYYNLAHGYDNICAYFYNNDGHEYNVMSSDAGGAPASILGKIQDGVGFANYTAHCSYDGWADPSISRSDISSFNNVNEYPFMIGNCCQSFMFNESDAFGEMLLYTANEGAVGYIGTSQYSYWYEDAYWGMGLTSLTLNTAATYWDDHTYANTGLGVYDGVWHENGEAWSDWYYTGRQMVHMGNLAVTEAGTGYVQYYWEIYHLVGDPSLAPYNTEPDPLSLSFTDPMQGDATLVVTTEPYTYVALSKDNVLLDAQWSGSGTSVTLTPPSVFNADTYCVVGTKQDRAPYVNEGINPSAANPPIADFSGTPTTILEGESVTFTDMSQYAVDYSWDFGDGSPLSTDANPVHTYTSAGTYTVALTVSNALDSDTETKLNYITVNVNTNAPTANFVASETAINVFGTVDFTDLSTDNPSDWYWEFEGGTPATSTAQHPTGITYDTPGTYTVTLTATNAYGFDDEVKVDYITVTVPDYCDAYATDEDEYISNVTFNTIDNTTAWDGYADFTGTQITNVTQGSSYAIAITNEVYYSYDEALVWIDYNIDGDFEDAGELVYQGPYTGTSTGDPYTWNGTVDIPLTATVGTTRMRVRLNYDSSSFGTPNSDPCGEGTYGEVEDYGIVIDPLAAAPIADFEADVTEGCYNLTVNFTDLSENDPTDWDWTFGDGGTSTDENPTYNYTSPGTYSVTLVVTNGEGSDNITYTNLITVGTTPTVDAPADVTECDSYTLPALTNGDYYLSSGGVSPISAGSNITSTTTVYVWDANGNCEAENSFLVTINETPVVDAPADVTECGSYTLPALTSGDYYQNAGGVNPLSVGYEVTSDMTIYVYEANGLCTDENNFSVTILDAPTIDEPADVSACETYSLPALTDGDYFLSSGGVNPVSAGYEITGTTTVYVWATNGTCDSEHSFTVTIDDMPLVDAPADVEACGEYILPALTNGAYYTNTGGVGPISVGTPITTDQTIYVYASNGSCEAENSFTVTIFETFTANAVATDESAEGANDGSVTVTMIGGTAPFSGTWTPSGTTNTGGTSMTLSGLTGGYYSVIVEDDNGCTATAGATVNTPGVPPVAGFEADVTEGCGTLTVNFTDLSTNNPTTYVWNFGDGDTSGDAEPTHIYDAPGVYTVTLYVENADGDDNETMIDYIHVYSNPDITVDVTPATGAAVADGSATANITGGTSPFTITWSDTQEGPTATELVPGNYSVIVEDANGCLATTPFVVNWVNLAGEEELVYSIYPNPASDFVYVQFDGKKSETIQLWDMLGQIVNEFEPKSDLAKIDISGLQSGVYFVKVIFDNKEFTHKLIIK